MKKEFSLKGRDYVQLKNLMKLLDFVNSGGEAKMTIQGGGVEVNGEVDTRRGRKLRVGDLVKYNEHEITIIS